MNGSASKVEASLVDGAFRKIAPLPLTVGDTDSTYMFTDHRQCRRIPRAGRGTGREWRSVPAPVPRRCFRRADPSHGRRANVVSRTALFAARRRPTPTHYLSRILLKGPTRV